ncbi:MAG: hypothetical protein ACRCT7_13600 [Shewanella sp.]
MNNNKKRNSLVSRSEPNGLKEFWSDVSEMGLDKLLETMAKEHELLREIPVIKWFSTSIAIKNSIQSAVFIKKYANFIGQVNLANFSASDEMLLNDAISSPLVIDEIVENTMIYLDRYHNELKAKLLGKLFVETFKFKRFSIREYNSLLFSIEQIHPFEGLEKLKEFYEYKIRMDNASEDEKRNIWTKGAQIEFQTLAMSGLLRLPSGGSYAGNLGGAYINEKGVKFYEFVVCAVIE